MSIYQFKALGINGKEVALSDYKGKTILIVNVASKCGFTPQYKGLEEIFQKYKERGLVILGFPCNQFGNQESGSNAEIQSFCELNFGVKFPLFGKVDVNGPTAHPLFQYLTQALPGFLWTRRIKWNFTKFLIDREGNPVKRFSPNVKPEDLTSEIEKYL